MAIALPTRTPRSNPCRTAGGGGKPEPELDRLTNIVKAFNDQWGNIPWKDADKMRQVITEDIPAKVAADKAYQNAMKNSDKQNARIEHDKALEPGDDRPAEGRHRAVQAVQRQSSLQEVALRLDLRGNVSELR